MDKSIAEQATELQNAIDHVDKIETEIRVHGHHKSYEMRIPADPNKDSDFMFSIVLDAAREKLKELVKKRDEGINVGFYIDAHH